MSATAILDQIRAAGVHIRLDPVDPDRLRLAPPDRLTPDLLELAREHKAELLSALRATASVSKGKPLPTPETLAAWSEYLSERSAVMEHDGELSRGEADWRAWSELLAKYPAAASHFAAPPAPPPPPTYTRCTDCAHFEAPGPDSSFWCRQVRAHPEVSLWSVCTAYSARPGTPPGPTVPPVGAS